MSAQHQQTANDYRILVEALNEGVSALRGAHVLARSNKARVMHETRVAPTVYFPREDIQAELIPAPDHRTFCPFKGTATYSHVRIGGETVENGAWCYEHALPEGRAIEGHIGFMPGVATKMVYDGRPAVPLTSGHISGPTVDWLLREAWLAQSPEELTAAIGRRFVADGIAVFRFGVLIWSLHPQIAGRHFVWTREGDQVKVTTPSHDHLRNPAFANSPLRHVSDGLGGVRQKLDVNPDEFGFPIMEDLRAQGATDYVAMPLPFSGGQINVMTLASDHPKGFTTANLGLIFECAAIISRLYEVFALKANATALLETYLGRRTGARVLGGEIRRGDGDVIDAAILFCDLRHSTRLEQELGRTEYLKHLNHFFETVAGIINDRDGEVLKFIGDAVLAIFPAGDDRSGACRKAVDSAKTITAALAHRSEGIGELGCAIGIAFGEVTYGNVGSRDRLDFTVIGNAANVAARLSDHGKRSGHGIVATDGVLQSVGETAHSLGALLLHNVARPVSAGAIAAS